ALANGLRLTRETVVVTDMLHHFTPPACGAPAGGAPTLWQRIRGRLAGRPPVQPAAPPRLPQMVLLPDQHRLDRLDSWWALSPEVVQQFLAILGFEDSVVTTHQQPFQGRPI